MAAILDFWEVSPTECKTYVNIFKCILEKVYSTMPNGRCFAMAMQSLCFLFGALNMSLKYWFIYLDIKHILRWLICTLLRALWSSFLLFVYVVSELFVSLITLCFLSFDGRKKRTGGSKESLEKQRLLHKYKREMKGTIREVRKDAQFIARTKLDDQIHR